MKLIKEKIFPVLMGLVVMIFSISLAVTISLNCRSLYVRDMKQYGLEEYTGYSEQEILENYDVLIQYNSLFGPKELNFPSLPMSESGRIHFVEVKNIFVGLQIAGIISFVLAAIYFFACVKKRSKRANLTLKSAAIMNIAIPALVAGAIALNWEKAFVTFHQIFFNNEYWIFDWRTDPIILMLPDEYFMHCAILIIVIVILFSLFFGFLHVFFKKNFTNP